MARQKKTKSSLLAKGLEQIESGVKCIREFHDNIDPFLLDSEKLKQIKPLIDNLAKAVNPQDSQETPVPDAPFPDAPDPDIPVTDTPLIPDPEKVDQDFNACDICKHEGNAELCNSEGAYIVDNKVKSCTAFTLNPEPGIPKRRFERMKKMLTNTPPVQE